MYQLGYRPVSDSSTSVEYKLRERKNLEEAGYRIIGNMGDQWSDLIGTNVGNRIFKSRQMFNQTKSRQMFN